MRRTLAGMGDCVLLLVFILATAAIASRSYFDSEGCLTEDSTHYLKLAQSLVDGKGWVTTPCNFESDQATAFFAIWPVGYPVMIAIISWLTGLSVFAASKAVSVLMIALLILLARRSFGSAAAVCASTLLFAPFLDIFSLTMSEVPFIFGLVWFCVSLHAYVSQPSAGSVIAIMASALLVFSVRYIGFFLIGILGLLALYFLYRRQYRSFFTIVGVGVLCFLVEVAYLYHNFQKTGYITGMLRAPSFSSAEVKLVALSRTVLFMLNPMSLGTFGSISLLNWGLFAVTFLFEGVLIALFFLLTRELRRPAGRLDALESILFLVGAVAWGAVVVFHWISNIDLFNYRLFCPGALLFIFGGIHYVHRTQSPAVFRLFGRGIAMMAVAAFGLHVPIKMIKQRLLDGKPSYPEYRDSLVRRYQDIPAGSAVMIGSTHVNYLRPDLRVLFPYFGPRQIGGEIVFYRETIDELIRRSGKMPYRNVFLDVQETILNAERVHDSFRETAETNIRESFVRIR